MPVRPQSAPDCAEQDYACLNLPLLLAACCVDLASVERCLDLGLRQFWAALSRVTLRACNVAPFRAPRQGRSRGICWRGQRVGAKALRRRKLDKYNKHNLHHGVPGACFTTLFKSDGLSTPPLNTCAGYFMRPDTSRETM